MASVLLPKTTTSASLGIHLLLKMVSQCCPISVLRESGINPPEHFLPDELKLHDFINKHVKKFKVMPSYAVVVANKDFNHLRSVKLTNDPLEYFASRVKERQLTTQLVSFSDDLNSSLQSGKIDDALMVVQNNVALLRKMDTSGGAFTRDAHFTMTDTMRQAMELHDSRRDSTGIRGMSLGLPYIDHITDGICPGDFAAIVARPGQGKTYFMLNAAMRAWLHTRKPGIIVSYEMPASQLGRRCLGLGTGLNTNLIKKGKLSNFAMKEIHRWVFQLDAFNKECPLWVLQGSMDSSLAYLEDFILEKKPEWVCIDAAYLMRARKGRGMTSRTDNIADGAEGLKQLAMVAGVPVLATYQYNRKGAGNLDNIMYSDSIGQCASLVFDIDNDKKTTAKWQGIAAKVFSILKGRDGEQASVRVLFDVLNSVIRQDEVLVNMDTGISQYQIDQMNAAYGEFLALNLSEAPLRGELASQTKNFSDAFFAPTIGSMGR